MSELSYCTIPMDLHYDTEKGSLVIETQDDCIILDRDEAVSLAEKLRDWVLNE